MTETFVPGEATSQTPIQNTALQKPRERIEGIFPTFFLSGFECSTFLWQDKGRRDLALETQHSIHFGEDYQLLRNLGIAVAREGIPWPLVDIKGEYNFSRLDPMIAALNACQILPIWDLCHYGYPDDLDPLADTDRFVKRFARYCQAAAEYVVPRMRPGRAFFTPINEISFFSEMGGGWGWVAPFKKDPESRDQLRRVLCRAAIAGVKAIRDVYLDARMVHVDPLVQVVAPTDRPDLQDEAHHETYVDTFVAWDIIAGRIHPELGGSPEILDIVGANSYAFGQMEYREAGPHEALAIDAQGIVPLCDMLERAWLRYRRPIILAETGGLAEGRPWWLRDVMEECLAAVSRGVELHGVCLFPAVDMPSWHTGEWLQMGICDVYGLPATAEEQHPLTRVPHQPYVDELRRWQKILNRVEVLDDDPLSDPVDLNDIKIAADRLQTQPDKDWS
ncbi:MAG: family 1 glycosylhydrolase [Akkermansiaceae bacterium]|nr:family 1 glycosylhydrolase [Armatimonadota bacterium]